MSKEQEKLIRVRIKSTFAIGPSKRLQSQFASGEDLYVEVDLGTTVKRLLHQLRSIGPPEEWDDIMINVFVNRKLRGFNYVLQPDDVIDLHVPVSGG